MCTGLEPLLVEAGASAGVASLGATALGTLGVGALAKSILPKPPSIPASAVQTPEKPPQVSKAPDLAAISARNAAAAGAGGSRAGNSSTFLTGPNGIDPGTLNLGRNSLLGQ